MLCHRLSLRTRIAILHYDIVISNRPEMIQLLNALKEAGHNPVIPEQNLENLSMKPKRVARLVRSVDADAWVVVSGSQEVLAGMPFAPIPR